MLLKLGKWLLVALLFLALTFTVLYFMLSRSIPEGQTGAKADDVTNKMLTALNYEDFKKLEVIRWTYLEENAYVWHKQRRVVEVRLPAIEVQLDFGSNAHKVIKANMQDSEAIQMAIANFYNDSFWLAAPFKIKDKGTTRKYVETKDGPGILVTYASGGVTPGDSYLWVLDENYRPKYWRIWTSNVRIPGLKFEWSDWQQLNGVWFATAHPGPGPISIDITDLEAE